MGKVPLFLLGLLCLQFAPMGMAMGLSSSKATSASAPEELDKVEETCTDESDCHYPDWYKVYKAMMKETEKDGEKLVDYEINDKEKDFSKCAKPKHHRFAEAMKAGKDVSHMADLCYKRFPNFAKLDRSSRKLTATCKKGGMEIKEGKNGQYKSFSGSSTLNEEWACVKCGDDINCFMQIVPKQKLQGGSSGHHRELVDLEINNLRDNKQKKLGLKGPKKSQGGSGDHSAGGGASGGASGGGSEGGKQSKKPNVLVLMLDAVSREIFNENCPKTKKVLEGLGHSVVSFDRFSVVGRNSPPNQLPLFIGHRHPGHEAEKYPMPPGDNHVWKSYKDSGYITLNGDDGETAKELLFDDSAIDHKGHPNYHNDPPEKICYVGTPKSGKKCGAPMQSDNLPCTGNRLMGDYLLDYIKDFWRVYDNKPKFATIDILEGHEDSLRRLSLFDKSLSTFFEDMKKDHRLDNTIIFLMADHGVHFKGMRYLMHLEGALAHRNPLLKVIAPKEWADKMSPNKDKMVTMWDMYKTFLHLSKGGEGSPPKSTPDADKHGKSLLETVPDRSCDEAGIEKMFCGCFQPKKGAKSSAASSSHA